MTSAEAATLIDAYFLGTERNRDAVFSQLGAWSPEIPSAVALVRAIAQVGSRAADESLMALRAVLAGHPPSDNAVQIIKRAVQALRTGEAQARAQYEAAVAAP